MNPDPTAAAVCIACNTRTVAPGSRVCDVCRERAAAASAQMAEAKRLADEATAAIRAPKKAAKPKPGERLARDLEKLAPAPPTDEEAAAAIGRALDELAAEPPEPERVRVRVRATPAATPIPNAPLPPPKPVPIPPAKRPPPKPSPMTNPPAGRGPKTCCQCNQPYGERPDPDDAAIRCGECVRANRAVIRNFTRGR